MNQYEEIMASLPPSSRNNSREIVKQKVERFEKNPHNGRLAGELEALGFSIDFKGNGGTGSSATYPAFTNSEVSLDYHLDRANAPY